MKFQASRSKLQKTSNIKNQTSKKPQVPSAKSQRGAQGIQSSLRRGILPRNWLAKPEARWVHQIGNRFTECGREIRWELNRSEDKGSGRLEEGVDVLYKGLTAQFLNPYED
jgi:hypothetical protein